MATTSIWRVTGWLVDVVDYAKNPKKTDNPAFAEKSVADGAKGASDTTAQSDWLDNVINYAVQDVKTIKTADAPTEQPHDETIPVMRRFVTGVNCCPETAHEEMTAVKAKFGKAGGVVAYHGYQSFAEGEVTPELAHEIGVKLAEKLWGERYQVVVATHLDKAKHLHNHFVLNNVSMVDGRKYYRSARDYWLMRQESDALCREYGLSVIKNPERGKAKHYGEWKAEQTGRQTWRGTVKADVDAAISAAMTERQFWDNLRKMGYEVKVGKDISVLPQGKERFVRLFRNFGEDYYIDAIRKRILAQRRPSRAVIQNERNTPNRQPRRTSKKVHFRGNLRTTRKLTGFRALSFYYLYKLGVLPQRRQHQQIHRQSPKRVYFLFREDIRHLRNITQEIRLLSAHGIDTAEQLNAHKDGVLAQVFSLCVQRKGLRNQARRIEREAKRGGNDGDALKPNDNSTERLTAIKSEISELSKRITALRREVLLCDDISERSADMKGKIGRAREFEKLEKSKGKELSKNEPFRRRG